MVTRTKITKSKIVCTLGPASNTPQQIKTLADLGMDCARINFSHGTPEYKVRLFNDIRQTDDSLAILCDIQGPKIRIGEVGAERVILQTDKRIWITAEDVTCDEERISIPHRLLAMA